MHRWVEAHPFSGSLESRFEGMRDQLGLGPIQVPEGASARRRRKIREAYGREVEVAAWGRWSDAAALWARGVAGEEGRFREYLVWARWDLQRDDMGQPARWVTGGRPAWGLQHNLVRRSLGDANIPTHVTWRHEHDGARERRVWVDYEERWCPCGLLGTTSHWLLECPLSSGPREVANTRALAFWQSHPVCDGRGEAVSWGTLDPTSKTALLLGGHWPGPWASSTLPVDEWFCRWDRLADEWTTELARARGV
mmetsp:Transcript_13376/g.34311  ORF Transcript_13376/g.34311 Transcript_13376/m.34311 type:complete len:252 (+) Transcript_13376:2-757(+)